MEVNAVKQSLSFRFLSSRIVRARDVYHQPRLWSVLSRQVLSFHDLTVLFPRLGA